MMNHSQGNSVSRKTLQNLSLAGFRLKEILITLVLKDITRRL